MSVVFGLALLGFYSEKAQQTKALESEQSHYFSSNQFEDLKIIEQQSIFSWQTFTNQITPRLENKITSNN